MQVIPDKSKEIQQKKGFDEQTKLHFQWLLEKIDRKQQSSNQNTASNKKTKYVKFASDKERKVLNPNLFTRNT